MEAPHDPNALPGQRGYLGPGWDKIRPYGKPEGLADRLLDHIEKLGRDKTLPWVGLGLIDDLQAASDALRAGAAGKGFPAKPTIAPYTPPPPSHNPKMEFDL